MKSAFWRSIAVVALVAVPMMANANDATIGSEAAHSAMQGATLMNTTAIFNAFPHLVVMNGNGAELDADGSFRALVHDADGRVVVDRREATLEVTGQEIVTADKVTLRLNASVFFSRHDDKQVRTSFQLSPGDPTSFGFVTINVEEAQTVGLEADVRWLPTDRWMLYATLGLLDHARRLLPQPAHLAHVARMQPVLQGACQHEQGRRARTVGDHLHDGLQAHAL